MTDEEKKFETLKQPSINLDDHQPRTLFEDAQRIEGGGPIKKVDINSLPKPIRIFRYFILIIFFGMLIIVLVTSIIK